MFGVLLVKELCVCVVCVSDVQDVVPGENECGEGGQFFQERR